MNLVPRKWKWMSCFDTHLRASRVSRTQDQPSILPCKAISVITQAGKPTNPEEVKSFLQACQYNAKFMFDSNQAYVQVTQPLWKLIGKNVKFECTATCKIAYQEILHIMMAKDIALGFFHPSLKTIMVANTGPVGIAASVFQAQEPTTWIPNDHASSSPTHREESYAQIEKESLVQSWGMNTHRSYILGLAFNFYTDHQILALIYNATHKPGPARVERHHLKIQDL